MGHSRATVRVGGPMRWIVGLTVIAVLVALLLTVADARAMLK
ncbi:MAG: hypothetical protein AAGE01_25075 [Pseudomonadota bacterium]